MPQARLSPEPLPRPGEVVITPWSYQSLGATLATTGQVMASSAAAWLAAGLVEFVPFGIPETMVVTKLFLYIGAPAGNIDLGIYNTSGNLLVSAGSTAVTASATFEVVDVTDTALPRGSYYLAAVADTVTTLTIVRVAPAAGIAQAFGLLEQAGVTLPLSSGANPATFAVYTRAHIPVVGLMGYRSVGP